MADNFLNLTGLSRFKNKLDNLFAAKQDLLVSGTNIKTIGGITILGSGNIEAVDATYATAGVELTKSDESVSFIPNANGLEIIAVDDGNDVTYFQKYLTDKTYVDTAIATELENFEHQDYTIVNALPATGESGVRYLLKIVDDPGPPEEFHMEEYMYIENAWRDCGRFDSIKEATDTVAGTIKLNPNQSITLNSNGQLVVGGRMGQFSSQAEPNGGLYYPLTIQPELVAKNSLLISEATNLTVKSARTFALFAGAGVTLKKTAAAGATTFEVSNTFANRFTCAAARGGYATIDETSAGTIIVKVTSVHTANNPNTQLVPYSGATESGNNIIITTDQPISTTDSLTKLRLYGSMTYDSSVHIGQGVGTGGVSGKGKLLQLGQSQCSLDGNSILVGNAIYNSKNRVAIFGASHINHVQGACLTGEGQDSTNGTFVGLTAHGKYSNIGANTAFVIGNGTSATVRSNLFEVADNNGQTEVIMNSPSGNKFKLTVADDGTLSTTAI